MTNPSSFVNLNSYNKTISLIDAEYNRSKEEFIQHFRNTYSNPYPPAWELAEILSLGTITRIYDNLANFKLQKKIAQYFGLNIPVFKSWLTIITLTRNACCHHTRVWNKVNTVRALSLRNNARPWISSSVNPLRIYFNICIMKWFVDVIAPGNHLKTILKRLLNDFPMIDATAMGFPSNWEQEPLWQI